jgi:hypothetical protein
MNQVEQPATRPPYSQQILLKTISYANVGSVAIGLSAIGLELSLSLLDVGDQISNGADLQAPLSGESDTILASQHAMVMTKSLARGFLADVDNFANNRGMGLASQSAEVNSSLSMTRSLSNTTRAGSQRKDMAWTAEAIRTCVGVSEGAAS